MFELTAILLGLVPLAFASAIIRYRLMDVEVIIKRGLVYAAAIAAIAAIYRDRPQDCRQLVFDRSDDTNPVIAFLATMVLVLLARPVKNAIQTGLDRVFYRDRYDYRRALVGFARDLNSDLDLLRLSERLVRRVTETLLVDRMALLLPMARGLVRRFVTIAHAGFGGGRRSTRGSEVATRLVGQAVYARRFRCPRRVDLPDVEFWRARTARHYFVPCVSKEGDRGHGAWPEVEGAEPLSSEDMAF